MLLVLTEGDDGAVEMDTQSSFECMTEVGLLPGVMVKDMSLYLEDYLRLAPPRCA